MAALLSTLVCGGVASAQEPAQLSFEVARFSVIGNNPVSSEATARLLAAYTGTHTGTERLQDAALALEAEIHALGFTFVRVVIPRQPLDDGDIELTIVTFTVDEITISGNEHFGESNVRRSLPGLAAGLTPNMRDLSRSLAVGKLHPARQQKITFSVADAPGKVDARIQVQDREPDDVFVWVNDTGSEETGSYRAGIGYRHSNLLDRDHDLTVTATTSPTKTEDVAQLGAAYQFPLYRRGALLSAFAADSDIDSGRVADFFDVAGKGSVLGVRYTQFVPRRGGYAQQFVVALTDKSFDNNIAFEGVPIGVDVRSRPLSLRYHGDYAGEQGTARFYLEATGNLSGGTDNDASAYAASRALASNNWSSWRLGADVERPFGRWMMSAGIDAQYTGEPLIAGEQFGLGGAGSVRGFGEREVSGDRGYQLRLELRAPAVAGDTVQGVGFLEGGETWLVDALPGEIEHESIASAGIGLQWIWRKNLSAQVDFAYVLDGTDTSRDSGARRGDQRAHFNLAYRF